MEYCVQSEHPMTGKDIDVVKRTQGGAAEMVRGQEYMMHEERLRELFL